MQTAAQRRTRLFVPVLLVAAVLLVGCGGSKSSTGGSTPAPTTTTGGTLQWGACTKHSYTGHYQCATLQVPLDHSGKVPGTIDIALIKTPATDPSKRIGSLLVNPGGPGGSAVSDWDFLSGQVDSALHQRFDVIGFDPRGVGDSTAVDCVSDQLTDQFTSLDLAPTTPAETAALESTSKAVADACAKDTTFLSHVGTADAAEDMDDIRQAVGDQKLTYLGFSYGTLLGATYAQEFPTHVRALVLDGAEDPALDAVSSVDQQSKGFQAQLDAFLASCASSKSCAWKITGDPHQALRSLLAGIEANPLPTSSGRKLTVGNAFYGIGVALYDRSSWPVLQQALGAAASGSGTQLLRLSDLYTERNDDGTYSNEFEANLAINCADYAWPATPTAFLAAAQASAAYAPDFGPANMAETLPCAYWPAAARGTRAAPGPYAAQGAPPILVIATTGDPATPYTDGVNMAKELSSGVLLTNVGEQHTAYGYSACTRKYADAYLIDLTNPGPQRCDDE